jgi:hypothetical protein
MRDAAGWDWEAYVDRVLLGAAAAHKMDVKRAEAYADELLRAPAEEQDTALCGDSITELREGAHKLQTLVALMSSQDNHDRSVVDSARKSIRSSLARVSESWGLSGGHPSPHDSDCTMLDESVHVEAEANGDERMSGCKRILSPLVPSSRRTPQSARHRHKQSKSLSPTASPSSASCGPRLHVGAEARGTLPSLLFSQEDQFSILPGSDEEQGVVEQATMVNVSLHLEEGQEIGDETQAEEEEDSTMPWRNQTEEDVQNVSTYYCAQKDPDDWIDASPMRPPSHEPTCERQPRAGHHEPSPASAAQKAPEARTSAAASQCLSKSWIESQAEGGVGGVRESFLTSQGTV